ncbi:hypothetical protein INT45_002191 [Circinella minor]|uniref:Uncharacterized protein n=1 Tax=Circinella minor TaxID=1195481 RepID=A0A8H7RZ75_9FUNG|nr:hypothetical protein INT45_002191 [Circinella minor]
MNPDQQQQPFPNYNNSFRGGRGGPNRGYGRGRGFRGGGRDRGRGNSGSYFRGRGGRGGFHHYQQQQPNFDQELKMDQPPDFSPEALERNYAQYYSPLFTKDPWSLQSLL